MMRRGKVSPRSRRYSTRALDTLADITARYPVCPDAAAMADGDAAWLNESIRHFYERVKATNYMGFGFRNATRIIRNFFAHSTGEETTEETQAKWKAFFDIVPSAKDELEANIKRVDSQREIVRKIEKRGNAAMGNEAERKRKCDALSDVLDDGVPQTEKVRFGKSQSDKELQKFLTPPGTEGAAALEYAKGKEELAEQIKEEMLECLNSAYEDTGKDSPQCPYFEENAAISSIQNMEDAPLMSTLDGVQKMLTETATGKDNTAKFDYYEKNAAKLFHTERDEKKEKQLHQRDDKKQEKPNNDIKDVSRQVGILSRNLKREIRASFDERYTAWALAEIDKRRRAFLDDLYKRIENYRKLETSLSPMTGVRGLHSYLHDLLPPSKSKQFGRLWDMAAGEWGQSGFEVLNEYADLLQNDAVLKELADLIGRQKAESDR